MSAYEALAASYDRLTNDVDYPAVLAYLRQLLDAMGARPETVLDLACGTGSLSVLLAQAGYRVLGADLSSDMLMEAYDKALELPEEQRPFFICQPMQELELPEPVDCVVCCLDSLNYLTEPADCEQTMRRVYEALAPGGAFLFDVNTPYKFRSLDGQVFLDEDEDVYCVWRAEFDEAANTLDYGMDLFQREGDLWRRSFEEHREYAYGLEELRRMLAQAGFTDVRVYGDRTMCAPGRTELRAYFAARKG